MIRIIEDHLPRLHRVGDITIRIEDIKENRYGKGSNYLSDEQLKLADEYNLTYKIVQNKSFPSNMIDCLITGQPNDIKAFLTKVKGKAFADVKMRNIK